MKRASLSETMRLARRHLKNERPFEALDVLREIESRYPQNIRVDQEIKNIKKILADSKFSRDPDASTFSTLAEKFQRGQFDDLIKMTDNLILCHPDSFLLWNIRGMILAKISKLDAAKICFEKAIEINGNYRDSLNNLGNILKKEGRLEEAIYRYDLAIQSDGNFVEAITNRATAKKSLGYLDDAVNGFMQALRINPKHTSALIGLSSVCQIRGEHLKAIDLSRRALSINESLVEAYSIIGDSLSEIGRIEEAIQFFIKVLELEPENISAASQVIHLQRKICDWRHNPELVKLSLSLQNVRKPVNPFASLSLEDNPRNQLQRSINFFEKNYQQVFSSCEKTKDKNHARIRVGYFSADFHDHATMYLMSGLLRNHNAEEFEIYCYSYGKNVSGRSREVAERHSTAFFDVHRLSNIEIVSLCRSHDLDISIDLKGFTKETRSLIFQSRLAPIQINFLGYPGSMGVEHFDYLVSDKSIIPDQYRDCYSENIIYLPHTYQPNDNLRQISDIGSKRVDFGLPKNKFVFCCFNNNYKISSDEFDIWMRILRKVSDSVFWLFRGNNLVEHNLVREAAQRGVDPSRLIFADRLPHAEHLERQKHADLFVDTFNVNAHTTASDALWAGLPVVTKQGKQFSARVASSLLYAIDLPELVTTTKGEYEDLIVELATDRVRLSEVRSKLARNRLSKPLFDTMRYTKNFENGLKLACDLYARNQKPSDIHVSDLDAI